MIAQVTVPREIRRRMGLKPGDKITFSPLSESFAKQHVFYIISRLIIRRLIMKLEQKYNALIQEAQRRKMPDVEGIRLCFQTLSLAAGIDQDCAALLAPHGLSEGRFILLFLLDAAPGGLAPNALADNAGVTRATVTGLLDGLEREGLIERLADTNDRRALCIRLTRKGKRAAKTVSEQHGRWIAGLYGNLSVSERKQLATLLEKVAGNLGRRAP